ncbi:hypothetical protein ABZ569_32360 [Streptomyces albus]|uniref:hypothetical protein n=1 Tax=Streptomyces albus TaxID=1888 RepID=UPI00340DF70A
MTTTLTFTYSMRHQLTVNGAVVRCPGRRPNNNPRQLTLLSDGTTVRATCGERHPGPEGESERPSGKAQCFWLVDWFPPSTLKAIAQQAKPGKIRVPLPGGKVLEGVLAQPKQPAASANAAAKKAAAAMEAKGKGGKSMAMPNRSGGGGALTAALNAVSASVTAAASVVGSAASVAESASALGREGMATARSGITAADNYGHRRHERKLRKAKPEQDDDAEE